MSNDGDHFETNSQREVQRSAVLNLQMITLIGEMQCQLTAEMETVPKGLIECKKRYDYNDHKKCQFGEGENNLGKIGLRNSITIAEEVSHFMGIQGDLYMIEKQEVKMKMT